MIGSRRCKAESACLRVPAIAAAALRRAPLLNSCSLKGATGIEPMTSTVSIQTRLYYLIDSSSLLLHSRRLFCTVSRRSKNADEPVTQIEPF